MSELTIPVRLYPEKATVCVPMSLGDGPLIDGPKFPLHELLGIKPPGSEKETDAGRTVKAQAEF
jgi:hypothetical protein